VGGWFSGKMRRITADCSVCDQPVLTPVALYVQTVNTGNLPGLGSETVPLNDPAEFIVPRSSISDPDPADAVRKTSVEPLLRVTAPELIGRTRVVGGFSQELVAGATVPSESTSRWMFNNWPSGREPLGHAGVFGGWSVKDQLPAASVCESPPLPPKPIKGSVLVSHAVVETSNVRQRTMFRT